MELLLPPNRRTDLPLQDASRWEGREGALKGSGIWCKISARMLEKTQPTRSLNDMQPVRAWQPVTLDRHKSPRKPRFRSLLLGGVLLAYLFGPFRTNILLLGTDDLPERGVLGRTDTIILTTVVPLQPYVGMLSIPRDLWVSVPNVGEQRINTAYFFAEADQPGSGPSAAMHTIQDNFNVPVHYYAVIHMLGLVSAVDALGGVDIQLDIPMADLSAGAHHLDGTQALAFVRERMSSNDFERMQRGQILLLAMFRKSLSPASWLNLPQFILAMANTIDTNIPIWQWPRLLFALPRTFIFGVDNRTITRDMVTPFQTSGGAQVLAPNWDAINPVLMEMFGR